MKRRTSEFEFYYIVEPQQQDEVHAGFECGKYCDCSGCYSPCARPDDHSGEHRCRKHMNSCFD